MISQVNYLLIAAASMSDAEMIKDGVQRRLSVDGHIRSPECERGLGFREKSR
jgi:hypothetical protein